MIARVWRGWTRQEDSDAYVEYLQRTGMRDYRSTPGNEAAYILRRTVGEHTEFVTLSFWASLEAITAFTGEDIDRAVFYPEDDDYFVDRETRVAHYEVIEPSGG
jgi:heme-degrading monooxygenase HmoA